MVRGHFPLYKSGKQWQGSFSGSKHLWYVWSYLYLDWRRGVRQFVHFYFMTNFTFTRFGEMFNLQIYVCGMLKHFSKLCSKKPQKSSPEFSRLCGRPPLPSRGGGQHAAVTRECVRQCVRLPSRAWCHPDSTHWLPSRCTSHSPSAP